jgi:alkyl hydroperoxide reductase subunit AhpC
MVIVRIILLPGANKNDAGTVPSRHPLDQNLLIAGSHIAGRHGARNHPSGAGQGVIAARCDTIFPIGTGLNGLTGCWQLDILFSTNVIGFQRAGHPLLSKKTTRGTNMSLRINSEAPNFTAETTQGTINFHEWIGNGWAILFSHPKDFTPVCTTELGYMAGLEPEFAKRNTKIIGLSVDPVSSHGKWAADIEETQGHKVTYPMIGDPELKVAKLYDMLPAEAGTTSEGRTAADNATVRTVFVIGPDKKIKLMLIYPMSSGRNFDEVLRALDSIQLSAKYNVATPVNWKPGQDVIIPTSVSYDQAKEKYPGGWKTLKPYLRVVAQPK